MNALAAREWVLVLTMNPTWLWALAAGVAIPLAAHLLSRRTGRVAVFPTLRFLRQAMEEGRRRVRVRDRLLLALRAAALLLAALAFARLQWQPRAWAGGTQPGGLHVLVLDRSASMTRGQGGVMLLDHARQQALALLESLDPARDRACVILLDAQPAALLPEPTTNFAALAQRLGQVPPTHERGDAATAGRLAQTLLRRHAGATYAGGRIEVFSDMQATQEAASLFGADLPVRLHPVGAAAANLALRRPTLTPAQPVAGMPLRASVEVANFAPAAASPVVALRVGSGPPLTRRVQLLPGGTATATFAITAPDPGVALLEFALEAGRDALPLDDRVGLFARISPAMPVAVVTAASSRDPATAAYFVVRALAPQAADEGAAGAARVPPGRVRAEVWRPGELAQRLSPGTGQATAPAFLVLVEAGALEPAAWPVLRRFLADGGGMLWVADSPDSVASLRGLLGESDAVPAPPVRWTAALAAPAGGRFEDPILEAFDGPARGALLRQAFARRPLLPLPATARPLLWFEDQSPLLATQWFGAGRLALWAAALEPASSDFVRQPGFAPLLHQLLRCLSPGPPSLPNPHPPGSALLPRETAGDSLHLVPAGPESAAKLTAGDTDWTIQQMDRVGPYAVWTGPAAAGGSRLAGGAWLELDPAESDLGVLAAGRVGSTNGGDRAAAAERRGTAGIPGVRPPPVELWPWLIAAAAGFLVLEHTLLAAGRWLPRLLPRLAE